MNMAVQPSQSKAVNVSISKPISASNNKSIIKSQAAQPVVDDKDSVEKVSDLQI